MQSTLEKNKTAVQRFNKEFIEQGNMNSFRELVSDKVINHAAPEGAPSGPESMTHFLGILRNGFPDIKVKILDQIAEGDKVTSHKELHGTHSGEFMGIPASGKKIIIKVIDIIRLEEGKYLEHWGMSNLQEVITQILAK